MILKPGFKAEKTRKIATEAIPKSAFQKFFEDWGKQLHKCIISEGLL